MTAQEFAEWWRELFPALRFAFGSQLELPPVLSRSIVKTGVPFPAAVDKKGVLYINPDEMVALFPDMTKSAYDKKRIVCIYFHECLHILLCHFLRAQIKGVTEQDAMLWNIATDVEINELLAEFRQDFGIVLERAGAWTFKRLAATMRHHGIHIDDTRRSAEEYFDLLKQIQGKMGDRPGDGESVKFKDGGSGVDGLPKDWEEQDGQGQQDGGQDKQDGQQDKSDTLTERAKRAMVEQKLREIAARLKSQGVNPGAIERACDMVRPKQRWDMLLRHFVAQHHAAARVSQVDWDMTKAAPESYLLAADGDGDVVLLPDIKWEGNADIGVVVDTSASISEDDLAMFKGCIDEIGRQLQCDIVVVSCDVTPSEPQVVKPGEVTFGEVKFYGGGGTDLTPAIQLLDKCRPSLACIVVLTDGIWSVPPPTQFQTPVVMVVTQRQEFERISGLGYWSVYLPSSDGD